MSLALFLNCAVFFYPPDETAWLDMIWHCLEYSQTSEFELWTLLYDIVGVWMADMVTTVVVVLLIWICS